MGGLDGGSLAGGGDFISEAVSFKDMAPMAAAPCECSSEMSEVGLRVCSLGTPASLRVVNGAGTGLKDGARPAACGWGESPDCDLAGEAPAAPPLTPAGAFGGGGGIAALLASAGRGSVRSTDARRLSPLLASGVAGALVVALAVASAAPERALASSEALAAAVRSALAAVEELVARALEARRSLVDVPARESTCRSAPPCT